MWFFKKFFKRVFSLVGLFFFGLFSPRFSRVERNIAFESQENRIVNAQPTVRSISVSNRDIVTDVAPETVSDAVLNKAAPASASTPAPQLQADHTENRNGSLRPAARKAEKSTEKKTDSKLIARLAALSASAAVAFMAMGMVSKPASKAPTTPAIQTATPLSFKAMAAKAPIVTPAIAKPVIAPVAAKSTPEARKVNMMAPKAMPTISMKKMQPYEGSSDFVFPVDIMRITETPEGHAVRQDQKAWDVGKTPSLKVYAEVNGCVIANQYGVRHSGFNNYGNALAYQINNFTVGADGACTPYANKAQPTYYILYGHLASASPAAVGTFVKAGELVGKQGMTGNANGVHTHIALFKLRREGVNARPCDDKDVRFDIMKSPLDALRLEPVRPGASQIAKTTDESIIS